MLRWASKCNRSQTTLLEGRRATVARITARHSRLKGRSGKLLWTNAGVMRDRGVVRAVAGGLSSLPAARITDTSAFQVSSKLAETAAVAWY